jgi:hypothetical protein
MAGAEVPKAFSLPNSGAARQEFQPEGADQPTLASACNPAVS